MVLEITEAQFLLIREALGNMPHDKVHELIINISQQYTNQHITPTPATKKEVLTNG